VIDGGKKNVLGVFVDVVDYEAAVQRVISAAQGGRPYGVTALAVHGVMTGVQDPIHAFRLNEMEMVVPDGQPVRWALNLLHSAGLEDRVYGPEFTLRVCAAAADLGLPVYFYGSKERVLGSLIERLRGRFPSLEIAGSDPSLFRQTSAEEKDAIARRIRESGARITFVGLGCPRQEVWAYEYRKELSMPVIAVGAAFDFHAGTLPQAPPPMQRLGLEWLFRLVNEPRRLWRRYLFLSPYYSSLLALQAMRLWKPDPGRARPPEGELRYG
jgi:N-acetylglucosaminyldiphosphoundecaprenol N-acetyl-beta-D-mannosaminyltransferase